MNKARIHSFVVKSIHIHIHVHAHGNGIAAVAPHSACSHYHRSYSSHLAHTAHSKHPNDTQNVCSEALITDIMKVLNFANKKREYR